jgi:phospholipid-binding lipoprotein MlaA
MQTNSSSRNTCGGRRSLAGVLAFCLLAASLAAPASAHADERDPWVGLNRPIFRFNDGLDRYVLEPVAKGYDFVTPEIVQSGITNFLANLWFPVVFTNCLLQGKPDQAAQSFGRFFTNTTIGLGGFIDVATYKEVPSPNEDFGQTLGYWGIGSGPYLMLPFLGPSSVRDGLGRLVDKQTDVVVNLDHIRTRNQFLGTRVVSDREHLLDSEKVLDTAAIDRYAFIRDAYLQRRRSLVYDGNPPPEPEDEEWNSKPRSQSRDDSFVSLLVDREGRLVAGPVGAPVLQPAEAVPPTSRAPAPHARRSNLGAAAPASSADRGAAAPAAVSGGSPSAAVVRVWLPGSQ